MAVDNTIRVTRDQLTKFIENHDTMRQFEILIALVNDLEERVAELELLHP